MAAAAPTEKSPESEKSILISPTEPPASATEEGATAQTQEPSSAGDGGSGTRFYQLTHDYLVPTIREWINQKQQETRQAGVMKQPLP